MTYLTLGQAAKESGRQKSTILEAIRSGRLSATRDDRRQWQIDPAELFRVFEPKPQTERDRTPTNTSEQSSEIARMLAKEQEERARERRQLENTIEDLRADRDHWRQQASALLTYRPEPEREPDLPPEAAPSSEPEASAPAGDLPAIHAPERGENAPVRSGVPVWVWVLVSVFVLAGSAGVAYVLTQPAFLP